VLVSGTASARITDFATFRARGAWAAGPFLPYAFLGVAVGRLDWSRTASVNGTATDHPSPAPTFDPGTGACTANCPLPTLAISENRSDSRNGVFAYGGAAGLGIDVALLPNLFVRGEWEIIQFAPVAHMHILVNTVRTAVGLKF
jgi:outer membrane immunogenic protein